MEAKAGISTSFMSSGLDINLNANVICHPNGYTSQAKKEDIESILYNSLRDVQKKIEQYLIEHDLESSVDRTNTINNLEKLFDEPIYIKVIPNEYSNDPYYWTKPWLLVTTTKGVIKIGWRKRVIYIDWSQSDVLSDALIIFPHENVTKFDRTIHAWSYEKAKEYLDKILL
jgi:hypothetical protein